MMDPQIAGKILDRIAELSKGNEARTMEYLETMNTEKAGGFERQKRLRERKQATGARRAELWATEEELTALKEAYPGPRGGTDWRAVITAALDKANHTSEGNP